MLATIKRRKKGEKCRYHCFGSRMWLDSSGKISENNVQIKWWFECPKCSNVIIYQVYQIIEYYQSCWVFYVRYPVNKPVFFFFFFFNFELWECTRDFHDWLVFLILYERIFTTWFKDASEGNSKLNVLWMHLAELQIKNIMPNNSMIFTFTTFCLHRINKLLLVPWKLSTKYIFKMYIINVEARYEPISWKFNHFLLTSCPHYNSVL